ncbi:MAG TPA: Hpt domain-containing protein [Steroidobacteraceae bacterium]|nr:Hpt domain-containing protein [Steroidobacteraceae bacterium]
MAEVSSQTLHIVARELTNELNEARAALEAFGEQQENIALLRKCNEHLHSVHGALRVAEVYGAALLAEEMGQVARYLIENFSEKRHLAEGLDALMRAMVQLPTYLERVLSGGRDMALVLLPLLNDLRAVRGHALLSEGTLLLLNLSSDQQASPVAAGSGEAAMTVAQWARKIRTRFQLGLLGWIKGERVEQNLELLSRAAEKLEQVATTQPVFQLWWVVGAVLEGLREGGLEGSASIKRLLGQADREMKRLYEQGEGRYAEAPALELLNNLLYYVARATTSGPRVAAVRASFRLSELLPVDEGVEQARESLSAPSVKLMKTVAAAIKEDLGRVKDALDIFVRQGGTHTEELAPQLELLKKIGDTLGVLGLGELRDKVQTETHDLQAIVNKGASADEASLLRMAATLIKVEDSLDEQLVGMIVPTAAEAASDAPPRPSGPEEIEFRQVTEAVLRECVVNMARIKEAIALSVEKPSEAQAIDQIPQLLSGISAGLLMLGKNRAVEVIQGIGNALKQFVRNDGLTLPQEAVDRLADAIVAVEYYMETLQAGRADPWYMLDNAETCLRFLAEARPIPRIEGVPSSEHARTLVIEPLSQTVASPTEHERTAVLTPASVQAPVSPKAPAQPVQQPPVQPAPVIAAADRPIDPEFLELFIEEAKDEIAKLNELFPRWDENPQEQDALVNVRRSFHTLKGSGRMVGAQRIGEFAWSIENLLNRVINKTLERTPDMMGMLRDAVAAVPELVEQLETGRDPRVDVDRIIAQANAIAGVRPAQPAQAAPASAGASAAAPRAPAPVPTPKPAAEPAPVAQKKTSVEPPMDAGLHEIYSKETAGHLATIREFIAACELANPPYPVTEDLHRSCHTLSGTAKTAGARQGIKIAEPLNRYVRKLFDNSIGISAGGLDAIKDSVVAIQQVVDHINEDTGYFVDHPSIVARLNDLEHAIDVEISRLAETLDVATVAGTDFDALDQKSATIETLAVTGMFTAEELAPPPEKAAPADDGDDIIELEPTDASAFDMMHWSFDNFPAEASVGEATIKIDDEPEPVESHEIEIEPSLDEPTNIQPALRVDETQNAEALDELVQESEEIVIEELDSPDLAASGLHPLNDPIVVETEAWAAEFEPPVLPADNEITLGDEPGDDQDGSQDRAHAEDMQSTQQVPELSMLDAQPEHATELDAALDLQPALDSEVAVQADATEAEQELEGEVALDSESDLTDFLLDEPPANDDSQSLVPPAPETIENVSPPPAPAVAEVRADIPAPASPVAASEPEPEGDEDFDPEVAAIFTDEATELLETADHSLSAWIRDRGNNALVFELKRVVHTLKGGARMAGLRAMGDLSHELETLMQHVENGTVPADQEVFNALQASLDELHRMRDVVASGNRCAPARDLIHRIRALCGLTARVPALELPTPAPAAAVQAPPVVEAPSVAEAPIIEEQFEEEVDFGAQTNVVPMLTEEHEVDIDVEFGADELGAAAPRESVRVEDKPQKEPTGVHAALDVAAISPELPPDQTSEPAPPEVAAPVLPPGREPIAQERQEFARVDADLLDTLLNNAGEVSIFRSRLEQQVTSIEFNLAELGRTVTRLKEQLRKLELETEAQILHRHEEEHPGRADFDPLELDRYSSIQQLSRAFAESVSDVGSIEGLLENLTREAQNLLLQQSRVVTELQNGLMRTRMVPFQRHVQRLSRLVRQVATDTGKRAELVVTGASGELDRQVLERMLPPFEHMLRNSVVHGIETPQERLARGKPENGTIKVGLHREGSEMVIVLEDDGRGIDVNAVREKAKQRGLIQSGKLLSDEEALQLILEPGFSTATAITQHAGRGVGMDVVVNEIKKLGGALFTESEFGKGVKFTIRLPFTLAITQALIVRTGDELYALPLPSVEGVARVQRSEVERHLAEETPTFSYGGQIYRFQHLGAYIGGGPSVLPETDVAVPVILIRAGEHSTAIVMDELVGTREMVVKSVGPQIATIRGISGATILGDGRIVIILDMGALVRSEWRGREQMTQQGPREDRRTFALVVDDSITVRRVTQRLLERHGMKVMTAKDGVDALSVLQEHLPDVILLDIEMPRMDGYEFATHVRADARTSDIPIVMITSRVGEKHRARAIEIGVNDYLGKPYQENQLLDAIEPLVQARRRKVS